MIDVRTNDDKIADKMTDLVAAFRYGKLSRHSLVKAVVSDARIWKYVLDFTESHNQLRDDGKPVSVKELVSDMDSAAYSESIYGGF